MRRFLTVLVILAIGLIMFILCDIKRVGGKIDSYKNVDIYYNGIIFIKSYGKNYSKDGYYYGQKWQCVEYIKRFFYEAKGHKMPDVYGNAKDFFDANISQGKLNKKRGLVQYINGDNVRPEPDDLLVFTDTKYGHVGIVTNVTDKYIEIIQQNIFLKTRDRLPITKIGERYYVGDRRKPAGWLRKE